MKFIRLLRFDLQNGFWKNRLLLLLPALSAGVFFLDYRLHLWRWSAAQSLPAPSFADYFLYVYGGMKQYIPRPEDPFQLPILWLLLFLSVSAAVLNYPHRDLQSLGQQVLIRTRGRMLWWASKCVWNLAATLYAHGGLLLLLLLLCAAAGVPLTGTVHAKLLESAFRISEPELKAVPAVMAGALLFAAPVLTAAALNLLQMLLSLFIRPLFSYLVLAAYLAASAYLFSPAFVGNYAMALRADEVMKRGVNPAAGMAVSAALALFAAVFGLVRFRRFDIINCEP